MVQGIGTLGPAMAVCPPPAVAAIFLLDYWIDLIY
jgi:hypothetical protein